MSELPSPKRGSSAGSASPGVAAAHARRRREAISCHRTANILHVVTLFLVGMAPRIASATTCASHQGRAACMVFRRQDGCAWDEQKGACVPDLPCESRAAARCAYELTTGAPWDRTLNKCFTDGDGACRWSDECTRLDGPASCASAQCQWTKLCVPASERIARTEQGNRCVHKCTPPGFRGGHAVDADATTSGRGAPPAPPGSAALPVPASLRDPAAAPVQAGSALASNDSYSASYSTSYAASYSYDCCGGDAPPPPPSSPPPPDVVVSLPGGARLRGLRLRGADTFLGVPFAAAPVGDLRWAAPAPLEGWGATKVFDATRYGARCMPLVYSTLSLTADRTSGSAGNSEECLNLNIFTPPAAAAATANATANAAEGCGVGGGGERCPRAPKAVMVWVHGGCSSFGSNQAPVYDGAPLASTQDVVVVSLNYRLGGLGFLGHDALRYRDTTGSGSTGNWGTLDAIAALRWVHENIAAFGGDPRRVTLFGQSSGAGLISQLLGAEPAWPYYHRVILESGAGPAWTYQDMRAAYHNFDVTAKHAGCGADSVLPQNTASIAAQVLTLTPTLTLPLNPTLIPPLLPTLTRSAACSPPLPTSSPQAWGTMPPASAGTSTAETTARGGRSSTAHYSKAGRSTSPAQGAYGRTRRSSQGTTLTMARSLCRGRERPQLGPQLGPPQLGPQSVTITPRPQGSSTLLVASVPTTWRPWGGPTPCRPTPRSAPRYRPIS